MIARSLSGALVIATAGACSNGGNGRAALANEVDSVSYAIGTDIGMNFKRSKFGNVNLDAMVMGLRDGLDSAALMDEATVQRVVESFMLKQREEEMKEERAKGEATRVEGEEFLAGNGRRPGVVTTPSGLQYEVVTMGTGAKPLEEDRVRIHYTGTLIDGTEFDSSVRRGEPVTFPLGRAMRGWVEGLQLMPAGSKWKLYIPSDLAYGPTKGPAGNIPSHSTLVFEIELLGIVE